MSKFNTQLKKKLSNTPTKPSLVAAKNIKEPTSVNRQGYAAHQFTDFFKLITILNTSKLEDQTYRSENEIVKELKVLIDRLASIDAYTVAQAIVYSRCVGEGMRSINHLAATFLAPYISGQEWAKRFYSKWDKKKQQGGCIFRTDDMSEIMACYKFFSTKALPNAMKKGFASTIESLDLYNFGKYTKQIRDVANMVHPKGDRTPQIKTDKFTYSILNHIMQGNNVPAETWENAQSDAGQIVAKAIKEGKLSKAEATTVLQEAKADNWAQLLSEGKLGILAALRNIRNILLSNPSPETVNALCNLFTNKYTMSTGKIMPYQIDLAYEIIINEFNTNQSRQISKALLLGYELALPNLTEILQGNNLVICDVSGSMWMNSGRLTVEGRNTRYTSLSGDKALLISATIAKSTNADIIRFGGSAEYVKYNPNLDVFTLSKSIKANMGATNLAAAWQLAANSGRKYDRVFILSDNECNRGDNATAYRNYVAKLGDPYVYSVDLAGYGTTMLAGPKVRYYYGYGYSMFTDIAKSEFNPSYHFDKIKAIVI